MCVGVPVAMKSSSISVVEFDHATAESLVTRLGVECTHMFSSYQKEMKQYSEDRQAKCTLKEGVQAFIVPRGLGRFVSATSPPCKLLFY